MKKINFNKSRIIFAIDEKGCVEGAFSDSDFRRYLLSRQRTTIEDPVWWAVNRNSTCAREDEDPASIEKLFSDRIGIVPILNGQRRLVSVAVQRANRVNIGDAVISTKSPAFVVAEIVSNHNGSLILVKDLVRLAAEAGANCAKFLMSAPGPGGEDTPCRHLSRDELFEAFDCCKEHSIVSLCNPATTKSSPSWRNPACPPTRWPPRT